MEPLVSIVIPTLNTENIIEDCLKSIREQSYPNIELIIVDAFSKDKTLDIAKKYSAKCFSYGFRQDKPFEKSFGVPDQRNFGVEQSSGKYVYYVDSDMRLEKDLIKKAVETIQIENADAVIVPEFSYGEGFWAQCRVLEKSCYNNDPYVDAARFIKKDIWQKLGGLDVKLGGGDDWDFQQRLNKNGYKTVRVDSHIMHYEGRLILSKQIKKKFVYGKYVFNYLKKHRENKSRLMKQFFIIRPAFIKNFKKLIKRPIYLSGLMVMKFSEYFAAFLGVVANEFEKKKGK